MNDLTNLGNIALPGRCCACGNTSLSVVMAPELAITCTALGCYDPLAWMQLMKEGGETEHIVRIEDDGHSIQHPIRERIGGRLFECSLFTWLHEMALRSELPSCGIYRVRWIPEDPEASIYTEIPSVGSSSTISR